MNLARDFSFKFYLLVVDSCPRLFLIFFNAESYGEKTLETDYYSYKVSILNFVSLNCKYFLSFPFFFLFAFSVGSYGRENCKKATPSNDYRNIPNVF